ncbi:MAG: hypothetical protein ACRD3T_15840 [Terriglobia bacterium]
MLFKIQRGTDGGPTAVIAKFLSNGSISVVLLHSGIAIGAMGTTLAV